MDTFSIPAIGGPMSDPAASNKSTIPYPTPSRSLPRVLMITCGIRGPIEPEKKPKTAVQDKATKYDVVEKVGLLHSIDCTSNELFYILG